MSDSRIKRPRVALVSYAEEHHDKLPELMHSLDRGGIREVLAIGDTMAALQSHGFQFRGYAGRVMDYTNSALRDANRDRSYGPDMPSIDMLCVTFTDISKFEDEFGHTNDTQDMELIKAEDLDRVALVLSACAGRRVVTATPGWERAIAIDMLEARTESDAWLAGRIREATQEVHKYVGALAKFQEEFAHRMGSSPRTNRPPKRER